MRQKRSVSVRLSEADIRKIKEISERLGVKDADLLRYFIKNSLGRLMPLRNEEAKGVDLIPVLMECGSDLARYLELDTEQLDQIVNSDLISESRRVALSDLELLTMANGSNSYASYKLSGLKNIQIEEGNLEESLKEYFYEKYSLEEIEQEQFCEEKGKAARSKLIKLETNI